MKVSVYKQQNKARVSKKEKKEIGKEINKINYICIIENTNKIKFSSFKRPNRFIFLSQHWNKREKPKLLIRNRKGDITTDHTIFKNPQQGLINKFIPIYVKIQETRTYQK